MLSSEDMTGWCQYKKSVSEISVQSKSVYTDVRESGEKDWNAGFGRLIYQYSFSQNGTMCRRRSREM